MGVFFFFFEIRQRQLEGGKRQSFLAVLSEAKKVGVHSGSTDLGWIDRAVWGLGDAVIIIFATVVTQRRSAKGSLSMIYAEVG